MDPLSTIVSIFFGVISALGTGLTAYFKLKGEAKAQIQTAIEKKVSDSESKLELRIQALELKQALIQTQIVKREDMVELRADLKNLMGRVEDLRTFLKDSLKLN